MTESMLVTGGTGTLGRLVVPRLAKTGVRVRVLSRHAHEAAGGIDYAIGDLASGEGIDAAVDGVNTIVHCAGSSKGDDDKARTLMRAAGRAGVDHVVNISVVGAERIPVLTAVDRAMFGYFASKRAAEEVIADSGMPWTNLRATQFHELVLIVAQQMAKLPVVPVPSGFRVQPVDAGEVAERLVALALDKPAGLVPDLAGPRVYELADIIRGYLRSTGRRRPILPIRLPGAAARAFRAGGNLPLVGGAGQRSWEDFLAERLSRG